MHRDRWKICNLAALAVFCFYLLLTPFSSTCAKNGVKLLVANEIFGVANLMADSSSFFLKSFDVDVEAKNSGAMYSNFCNMAEEELAEIPTIIVNTRPPTKSELSWCSKHGIAEDSINTILLGHGAIVFFSGRDAKPMDFDATSIFRAISHYSLGDSGLKANSHVSWHEVDKELIDAKILVYGPRKRSTPMRWVYEFIMDPECALTPEYGIEFAESAASAQRECRRLREDIYNEMNYDGANFFSAISKNPQTVGISDYDFYLRNSSKLILHSLYGVFPSAENLKDGSYVMRYDVYFTYKNIYDKNYEELKSSLISFLRYALNDGILQDGGYLSKAGIVSAIDPSSFAKIFANG